MKKLAAVVIALLVLANAFSLWRVHALGTDVDRLEHRPEPLPLAADPAPAPAPAVILGARLGASAARPADEDLARRLAALEAKIDALSGRVRGLEQTQETAAAVLAEFVAARLGANETAAIATGRNVISAQAQFQMSAKCDVDADGTGEYGGFLEMSGADAGRMATVLAPPVLSGAFRRLQAPGVVERAGYFYRVFLPDARGVGVGETPTGFDRRSVDANLSETTWCLYAWPVAYGRTGTRTFFTNQGGDVLATDAPAYGGADAGPSADAAFVDRGFITGRVAIGTKGSDGNAWKQVN